MKKILGVLGLLIVVFILSSCADMDYENRDIYYDGTVISWDSEKNEQYKVYVDGIEKRKISSSSTYRIGKIKKDFSVYIEIYNSYDTLLGQTSEVEFKYIASVDSVEMSTDGTIQWSEVSRASGYNVVVNNKTYQIYNNKFDKFDIGNNEITITPIVNSSNKEFTYSSSSFTYTKLSNNLEIDYDGEKIYWDQIEGNHGYAVYVNSVKLDETENNWIYYNSNNDDFNVYVIALGSQVDRSFDSEKSYTEKFLFLDTPINLNMEYGKLTWDAIDDADGYQVKIDNQIKVVTDNVYEDLPSNTELSVQIRPIADDKFFSDWSLAETIKILPSPNLVWNDALSTNDQENQNITWDAINGAEGYQIKVVDPNGHITYTDYSSLQLSYSNAYDLVGQYQISLVALGGNDTTSIYDSKMSNVIYIERLASPSVGNNYITSDPTSLDEGFILNYNPVSGASGYELYLDETLIKETTETSMHVTNVSNNSTFERQELTFVLKSVGKVEKNVGSSGDTRVYLGSQTSQSLTFDITILETPTDHDINVFIYSWEEIIGANGYNVLTDSKTYYNSTLSYNLESLEPGTYNYSISARGNGTNVLPSKPSNAQVIQRLESPTNLAIETQDVGEGELGFDSVAKALSYTVSFNLSTNELPYDGLGNVSQYIGTTGTVVTVRAVANYFDEVTGVYYISSPMSSTKQFTKLAVPTFAEKAFTNTTFNWNNPSNINTNQYTPIYRVYNHNQLRYNNGVNGSSMNISDFEAGTYSFYVKAIGDGITYINSDMSELVTVQKLDTVSMYVQDNEYNWIGVPGANSYEIYIDNELKDTMTHIAGHTYSYKPYYNELKDYNVQIIAKGDNGVSTIDSDPFEYVQKTKMLVTPGFTYEYSEEAYIEGGTINISVDIPSEFANGYGYIVAGTEVKSENDYYTYTPSLPGEYVLSVYALGGTITEDYYYISSLTSGGNDSYTIYIFSPPTKDSIDLTLDGRVSWGSVTGASSYEYKITFEDGTELTGSTTRTYYDIVLTDHTKVTVAIRVIGDGNNVTSKWIEKTYNLD